MLKDSFSSRLHTYDLVLGKYDLIDKYQFSTNSFSFIEKLELIYTSPKLENTHLKAILSNEFLTQRYLNVYKTSKFPQYIIRKTLRKSYLWVFLEFLLNSSLLNNKLRVSNQIGNTHLNLIIKSSLNDNFVSFLNELCEFPNNQNFLLYFSKKSSYFRQFLSYYFIF